MILYPAIDILNGRAVRLLYGKRELVTDYGDPLDCAKRWADAGARVLHVVSQPAIQPTPSANYPTPIYNGSATMPLTERVSKPVQPKAGASDRMF